MVSQDALMKMVFVLKVSACEYTIAATRISHIDMYMYIVLVRQERRCYDSMQKTALRVMLLLMPWTVT